MTPKLKKKIRRLRLHWRRQFIIGFIIVLLVFGSTQWYKFFQANSEHVPTTGGILTESTIGSVLNLNPLADTATVFDKDLHALIFSGLLEYNPTNGQVTEGLASFRVSEDGLEYFVTLKDSALFSNSRLVTADDVIFTYETILQNPNFSNDQLANRFEYVQINKLDNMNLVFVLPEPNAYFPYALTTPILYAPSFENVLIEEILDPNLIANKNPIGTGPYVLQNIVPEDDGSFRVFLERNQYFFKKKPFISQIVLYVYPTFDHLRFNHTWTTRYSLLPFQELVVFKESLFDQYATREYLLPRFLGLFFNLDKDIPANGSFRNALNYGVEKDKILNKNKGWERIDSLFFFEGVDSWHEVDFAEGRRLIREAGLKYNEATDQYTHKGQSAKISLITTTAPPVYSRFAQLLVQRWKDEYGLDIELRVLSDAEFQNALFERDYDLVLFGQDYSENFHSLATWHSSQSGGVNLSNLTNKDIDFVINEIYLTGAQSELFELSQKLSDLTPAVPIATPQNNLLVSPELRGFEESFGKLRRHSDRFYGVQDWYFKEKRVWNLREGSFKFWEFLKFVFTGGDAKED